MADINRTIAPPSKDIAEMDIVQAKEHKLSNGIPLYYVNAGTQDLVKIEFIFPAGLRSQTSALVASVTSSMLNEGTGKRSAVQIAEALDYYGAFFETGVDYDHASVSLYTLNKHLATTLPVVEEVLKDSIFPQQELNTLLQNKRQTFYVENQKVSHVARRRFSELIFGEKHPYGTALKENDFDALKQPSLVDFYKNFYHGGASKIVVAGKVDEATIKLLDKHFGGNDWKGKAAVSLPALPAVSASPGTHLVKKDDALQSAIRMGKVMFSKTHPDYQKMQVLNTIFGGYFGSRLMSNIREDKGYTYGIGSGVASLKEAGYFFISTEVGVDVCAKAVEEIYKEMKMLREKLVPEEELNTVRSYMLGGFLRSIDGPFALADKFKAIMEYGLGYDYYDRFLETIKTVTAKELRDLANKYLQEEGMTELVVGKK